MNPLWLCLIIPCSIWLGFALCALLTMGRGDCESCAAKVLYTSLREARHDAR